MKVKEDFNLKEFLIPYIATTIGSFIAAAGVTAFFIPHQLPDRTSHRYWHVHPEYSYHGSLLQIHGTSVYHTQHRRDNRHLHCL